jgi:predicted transcriptional regulator
MKTKKEIKLTNKTKNTLQRHVLVSILPKWADQILSGAKSWEYRKVAINAEKGSKLILYASRKLHAIVGEATIEKVLIEPVDLLIQHTIKEVPETPDELKKTFAGKKVGCAIKLKNPTRYPTPLSLNAIRKEIPNFRPPQSFYYVSNDAPLIRLLTKGNR